MKLKVICILILCGLYQVHAACRMYGECHQVNGFPRSCVYDGVPLPILANLTQSERDAVYGIIEHRCPYLLLDDDGNRLPDNEIVTCCDVDQIRNMADSLLLADSIIGRCPTCVRNFARQICEMNCSPDQARFIDVESATNANGIEFIEVINYRMHEDFMLGAFSSCSGILVPQTGLPAVNLMCGNAPVCDAEGWFGFSGDIQNNPMTPVQVNFLRWTTIEDSMHARAPPCNETSEGDLPCSCIDCLSNCPLGEEPTLPETCTILSVNCIGFGVGLGVIALTIIIFAVFTRMEFKKNINKDSKPSETELNIFIRIFQRIFSKIGVFSASNSVLMIMIVSWITFGMYFGFIQLRITSNPVELWSAPDSRSRHDMNYFNSRFGPFYRVSQVFMQFTGLEPFEFNNETYGPAFRIEAVRELIALEDAIMNIGRDNGGVTLEQVCFAPTRSRGGEQRLDQCVSMSVSTYFGDNRHNINNETYLSTILNCVNNHFALNCIASWGGGAEPELAFGGYEGNDILRANTLLINYPIANQLLEADLIPVLEWEAKFLELMHDYEQNHKPDYVTIAFAAERSIEDEIQRVSEAEVVPIVISYLLMFAYVIIALGNVRYCKTWFIDSKIMVAVVSIIVVVASIFCALGVMGYTGITITLLAINVIPFFILSVGIDNVFLMVNTIHDIQSNLKQFDDYNESFDFEQKRCFIFDKMMTTVGPSMFITSVTQITCFAIGTLANFPAVVTFSIFATLSLGFLFLFQITAVVAILSIDFKRVSQNRFDILFCIRKKILNDDDPLNANTPYKSLIKRSMRPYSKFILNKKVKVIISIIFMIILGISIILTPQIEIGLDQQMVLPTDSYVYAWLDAVNNILKLGPPVFFVLKSGLNFTDINHQNVICGGQLCYDDSLTTQIFLASRFSDVTFIQRSSNSWLDDFVDWTALTGACCRYNISDGSFCPSTDTSPDCAFCSIDRNEWSNGLRPAGVAFERYFPFFLQDEPTDLCNKGGLASYSSNVNYILDSEGRASIHDSNFMAYHVALATSHDYISAVRNGYEISANISAAIKEHTDLDVEVFPYSIFYVYYEQYLTMWADTFSSIGYCLIGALVFNLLASGFNVMTTFAVMVTALMVVINMMGVMYIWDIPLNAVSCVNLIVSIGIAVEFCSHIAYAFATSKRPSNEKVEDALETVGVTIITGITLTNLPIIVLAFSYTELIEVFFFRMFFSLVILGFLHGMVFFPVLLSYLNNLRS